MTRKIIKQTKKYSGTANHLVEDLLVNTILKCHTPVIISDQSGKILRINKQFEKLTGFELSELRGIKSFINKITADGTARKEIRKLFLQDNKTTGRKSSGPWEICSKNGCRSLVQFNILADSKICRCKITQLQTYERLQPNELGYEISRAYLYEIFDTVNDAIFIHDAETGKILDANKKACEVYGYSKEQFSALSIEDISAGYKPFSQEDAIRLLKSAKRKGTQVSEWLSKNRNGELFWVEVNIRYGSIFGEKRFLVSVRDISERKKSEDELLFSENKFRSIVDNSYSGIFIINSEFKFEYCNKKICSILKCTENDMLGEDFRKFVSKDSMAKVVDRYIRRQRGEKVPPEYSMKVVRKDGVERSVRITSSIVKLLNGETKSIAQILDVTDKEQAEIARKFSEEKFAKAFRLNPDIMIIISLKDGIIYDINDRVSEISGLKREDLIGKAIADFDVLDNSRERKQILSKLLKDGRVSNFEAKFQIKGSKKRTGLISAETIKIGGEDLIIASIRDIQEIKETEMNLLKAKEEAEKADQLKSNFLAQMSHEIRTPINAILSFSNLIKDEVGEKLGEDSKEYFDILNSASKRIIRTIDLILNTAEIQSGSFKPVLKQLSINQLLAEVYNEFKNNAKSKGLGFEIKLPEDDINIYIDEYSATQIFSNLIDNAIKYTREGKIKIELREFKKSIVVNVVDTGIGIMKEYMSDIFKPFTQEEQGYGRRFEGSGLGLSLVNEYCKLNNAAISVKSEKEKGTTFTVRFRK
ncbi:MAG: PAS domain S-box protein [Melioribacteraceae bacterium]|nr:PAS domain S-box protein [Melioribacteraceae bacterium]